MAQIPVEEVLQELLQVQRTLRSERQALEIMAMDIAVEERRVADLIRRLSLPLPSAVLFLSTAGLLQ